jgi:quinol monooxygenase YgiN
MARMPTRLRATAARALASLVFMCAALVLILGFSAAAQSQEAPQALYVVTHIDVIGPNAAEGAKLIKQFAADSLKDPGVVRFEALREAGRANHFTLVEVWKTRQDFEAHLAAPHSKAFREKLQPLLGSPFDERLHILLP